MTSFYRRRSDGMLILCLQDRFPSIAIASCPKSGSREMVLAQLHIESESPSRVSAATCQV